MLDHQRSPNSPQTWKACQWSNCHLVADVHQVMSQGDWTTHPKNTASTQQCVATILAQVLAGIPGEARKVGLTGRQTRADVVSEYTE